MAAERWPLPSDLKMEIDLHNEPGLVSFKLLLEKKSQSSMWEFLELCYKYSVDLGQMRKVAQTLVFKKHSDKNFDFVDYMERKGLKITLPSIETNPSGAAGPSTSGEGSKKLKGKALVKKLNVVTPKKPTTGTVEVPKKSTTGTAEAPKKSTTGTAELQRSQQQDPLMLQRSQQQDPLRLQRTNNWIR
ncbi:hypothetical protein R1sor_011980 [Riccia sorocarpa]|uniref:Uncharacterized protein n=1 Tax=Riccia sorocarpa TaxID=122646 RepID=A0ABD3I5V1_9MARC